MEKKHWETFTTAELRKKRDELRDLISSDMLSDRSIENQKAEIAMIEAILEQRDGSA